MQERSVIKYIVQAAGWSCDHENLRGRSGYYINQEGFDLKQNVSLKIHTSAPVCAAQPFSTLSYSTHMYILGN